MNRFFVVVLFSISIVFAQDQPLSRQPDSRGYIVTVGDKVEDFAVNLTTGTQQKLSKFNADVIVLNFFASWCVVCRKEVPHVENDVWQHFKDRNVIVIGVDYKEDLKNTQQYINDMKISYPVSLDPNGKIFDRFARGGVTRNVVLDKKLNIIYLTRLFNEAEFNGMITKIEAQLHKEKLP